MLNDYYLTYRNQQIFIYYYDSCNVKYTKSCKSKVLYYFWYLFTFSVFYSCYKFITGSENSTIKVNFLRVICNLKKLVMLAVCV